MRIRTTRLSSRDAGTPQRDVARPPRAAKRRSLVLILLLAAGAAFAIKHGRHHVFPKRFAEVVPGHLYRSGYLESGPLKDVIDRYHIKTILVLLSDEPDNPDQKQEESIARDRGVQVKRIGMPGDGTADFDKLEQAAAVLADESTHPVLVHCHAGVNRTGAVYAVWRMKYCGWDAEHAIAEAEERGYDPGTNPALREHLLAYWRTRITTTSPASSPAQ